ncbi:MAG: TolC family protein [Gammaproteobacteria bacterium]|nr:TolC family protein [Gammaproteobacteria bacterium]
MKYLFLVAPFVLILSGCVSVPADFGRAEVDELTRMRGLDSPASADIDAILQRPMSLDAALTVALLNNPEVTTLQAELMLGSAGLSGASQWPEPMLSFSRLELDQPGGVQRTLGLAVSLTDLLTLPARQKMARLEFLSLKKEVARHLLQLANQVVSSFYDYAASCQLTIVQQQNTRAAQLAAQLARRFYDAGNIDQHELEQARIVAGQAALALLDAEVKELSARTELATLLGLSVGDQWHIDPVLPGLPAVDPELPAMQSAAQNSRLDLAIANHHLMLAQQRQAQVGWTRWLGDVEAGYEREQEVDDGVLRGPTLDLNLPFFNQRRSQAIGAEARTQIAAARRLKISIAVDNDVKSAHLKLGNARRRVEVFQHSLLQSHDLSVQRMQEQYNFMLRGVFDLFEARRQQFEAYQAYLTAVRDYWLTMSDLTVAVGKAMPIDASGPGIDLREWFKTNNDETHEHHVMPGQKEKPADPDSTRAPAHHHHGT